jgi:hypothetical protein
LKALRRNLLNQMVDQLDFADSFERRRSRESGSERDGFWGVVGHVSETRNRMPWT